MHGDVDRDRTSPGEDGFNNVGSLHRQARAQATASVAGTPIDPEYDYLQLLKTGRQRLTTYYTENLQAPIDANYRAYRNKHFAGSKYWHSEYRNRSKLFRPKTRTAVRKADASAVAALFSTTDAVKTSPGDESNPEQQANAALVQELFNYRTDRTSGMAAMPWFRLCAGAHNDAMISSVCISKQYWKLELRNTGKEPAMEPVLDEATGEPMLDANGQPLMAPVVDAAGQPVLDDVWEPFIDRPDCALIPLENIEIDPSASWLSPIQSAAIFIAKYPMSIDEVVGMQKHPLNPWNEYTPAQIRANASTTEQAARATRQSREGGADRLDNRYNGRGDFETVWVFEVFIRVGGKDMTFWALQDNAYLTEPKPVKEVYPEQGGERPYTFGVTNLEPHRLFPMSSVESWQQGQIEINDFANLILDTAKLNVAPVTKVVRGAQVDLAALARRGPNSQILVTNEKDVTWDQPPQVSSSAFNIMERLNVDFDDQAGQFNSGTVQTNRSLNETVGGMKLIAGSANAVTEFDQRVWIETWVEPTIGQLVKVIQFYEADETILALCGRRAQLFKKFGISQIDDDLLQQQVTVKVDAGIGNADPMERLAKLGQVIAVVQPLFEGDPRVQTGEIVIDSVAIAQQAFALGGWRDEDRFVRRGQPQQQQNPLAGAEAQKIAAEAKDKEASAVDKQASARLKDAQRIKVLAEAQKTKVDTVAVVAGHAADQHDRQHNNQLAERDQQHRHGMERVGFTRELMTDQRGLDDKAAERSRQDQEFAASREDAQVTRSDQREDTAAERAHRDREFDASREDAAADRELQAKQIAAKKTLKV